MATKTISLKLEAYNRLRAARRYATESFSEVVMRASWPEETLTGAELLARCRTEGPLLSEQAIDRIEQLKVADTAPGDKWTG
jgi:predicted CopG family antitoxin